ncbi:MAG: nitroreductase/quinone reductase family protein [Anaerolineales bacterium]|nr:nitroreductase/quinone reductase family protein [Anaerolineales bacterium]
MATPRFSYNLMKIFWRIHLRLYLWSSGRIGNKIRGLPILILNTKGRKTGLPRTNALQHMPNGRDFVVIASNLGVNYNPAWWLNLKADPVTTIQVGSQHYTVRAREAEGEEREKLWKMMVEKSPNYEVYRKATSRHIPVVVLERQKKDKHE